MCGRAPCTATQFPGAVTHLAKFVAPLANWVAALSAAATCGATVRVGDLGCGLPGAGDLWQQGVTSGHALE